MNVALYKPKRGRMLIGREFYKGCTRDQVREMALLVQIEAHQKGSNTDDTFMVAWENSPSEFMSVFTLGDSLNIDEEMLNDIHSLIRTRH